MDKVIYIPKTYDGKRHGNPEIIYVFRYLSDIVQGSRRLDDYEDGRYYGAYPKNRCIPYTDEVWKSCQDHVKHRKDVEKEYSQLERLARRKWK